MDRRLFCLFVTAVASGSLLGCSGFNWNPTWNNRSPSGNIQITGASPDGNNWKATSGSRLTFVCNAKDPDSDAINYRWSNSFVDPTPSPVPTASPTPSASPSPIPSASPVATPTPSPTPSPTPTPTPTPTPSPTPTPTASPSPTPTPAASASPVETPTPIPISVQQKYEWIVPEGAKGKDVNISCLIFDDRGAQTVVSVIINIVK